MTFKFPTGSFTLEALLAGKISEKNFSDTERYIIQFVKDWENGQQQFVFHTSGSTGHPKPITLTREQLAYSAQSTLDFLFGQESPQGLLLCLRPQFIGGTQVIVRALLCGADLVVVEAQSNPLRHVSEPIDLASMVPVQLETVLRESPDELKKTKRVLIGGAALSPALQEKLKALGFGKFYQTFGMTETASHIALREVHEPVYRPMGDIQIKTNKDDKLLLKGTTTRHEWLNTNDLVELIDGGFVWKGRADWVINSGGIKVHPEEIEKEMKAFLNTDDLMLSALPDEQLSERVVLVTKEPLLDRLEPLRTHLGYAFPKSEHLIVDWPLTASGKPDRRAVKAWLLHKGKA